MTAWTWAEVGNSARTPICNVAPVIQAIQGATVVPMATVTLHRSGTGRIIEQGKTDANGRATILGAGPGDRVHFTGATATGTVSGDIIINCVAGFNAHSANDKIEVVLTPDPFNLALSTWPGSGADELSIEVAASVSLSETPQLLLQQSGTVTPTAITLNYDAGRDVYIATAILTTILPTQGILFAHAVNTQAQSVEALLPFNITPVEHDQHSTSWSSDGMAKLYLPPGALAANGRVSIVAAPLWQPLPEGLLLIGGPYAIDAAEKVSFSGSGNLMLSYPAHGDWETRVRLFGVSVYRWDGTSWQALSSTFDADYQYAAAPVNDWGVYAILTSAKPISGIYLPLVLRQ